MMVTKAKPQAKSTKTLSLSPSAKAKLLAVEQAKKPQMETITPVSKFKELVPYISCLVYPEDFEAALASTYSQIFVPTSNGYLKHMKLAGGRHVRVKVDSLPTIKGKPAPAKTPVIHESLNFLPAGKIPYEFFDQVVLFFREVVRLKKMEYEAHAWILWSKERGYFISIPKQTVSKAAVSFTYDEEALPAGSVIVVDLHSHNTMGSFFSGTDNNNDKTGIYYSGVIGNLTAKSFSHVIRFNLNEHKMACTLDDIFETTKSEVTIPNDWLDKVQIAAPVTSYAKGVHMGTPSYKNRPGYKPYGVQEIQSRGNGKWSALGSMHPQSVDEIIEPSFWDKIQTQVDLNPMDAYYDQLQADASRMSRKAELQALIESRRDDDLTDVAEAHIAAMKLEQRLHRRSPDSNVMGEGWEDISKYHVDITPEEDDGSIGIDPDESEDIAYSEFYEEFKAEFGRECAEAFDLIDGLMLDLEGCDKGLLDIARQAYGLMSDKGRSELESNGF